MIINIRLEDFRRSHGYLRERGIRMCLPNSGSRRPHAVAFIVLVRPNDLVRKEPSTDGGARAALLGGVAFPRLQTVWRYLWGVGGMIQVWFVIHVYPLQVRVSTRE